MHTIELDSAPSLASLYARAVSASVLPGSRNQLPDRRCVLRGVELEPERVAAYSRVCGFGVRSEIPATYPHVLVFPLHLSLMAERSFPFPALGLVHIANAIDLCAPIPVGDTLDLTVWAADLRPHDRGRQFDLHAEANLDDSLVWREVSTYLRRESSDSSRRRSERANEDRGAGLTVSADWSVPGDIGRRYADVSGDRNPIHLHPLLARPIRIPERDRPRDVDEGAMPRLVRRLAPAGVRDRDRVQVAAANSRDSPAMERPTRRRMGLSSGEPGRRADSRRRLDLGRAPRAVGEPIGRALSAPGSGCFGCAARSGRELVRRERRNLIGPLYRSRPKVRFYRPPTGMQRSPLTRPEVW